MEAIKKARRLGVNKEYIVFLNHLKIPYGYGYKGKEAVSYIPVSTLYSKYPTKSNGNTTVITRDELKKGITYNKVKGFDLITTNEEILGKYNALIKDYY